MAKGKPRYVKFGYGIVNAKGEPFWDEGCVCENRQTLETEVVSDLNTAAASLLGLLPGKEDRPYRVVTLYRRSK